MPLRARQFRARPNNAERLNVPARAGADRPVRWEPVSAPVTVSARSPPGHLSRAPAGREVSRSYQQRKPTDAAQRRSTLQFVGTDVWTLMQGV